MNSKVTSEQMYEFRKQIKKLTQFKGTGTEMISVYIASGAPLHDTTNKLREELSQASNIKSKSTKTNVMTALEKIIHHLKIYRSTPERGIAVFCGNVSDNPSKTDVEIFTIEPPEKLHVSMYRCDSRFFLEPFERMIETKDSYGLLVLDGREATLALMRGTQINVVKRLNSTAHQKIRKGGQSARRYERLIEESIEKYYKRVGQAMDKHFLNRTKCIIVGGPGPTKDFFLKSKTFNYQLKILGPVDTGYTDEYGLREVIAKSERLLEEQEAIKERVVVERFIKEVVHEGLATYGEKQVRKAIEINQAEKVLVSEGLDYKKIIYKCNSCNVEEYRLTKEKPEETIECPKCNSKMRIIEEEPLLDELVDLARSKDIEVEIISTNTTEGMQFLQGFAGIGAFLRYKK